MVQTQEVCQHKLLRVDFGFQFLFWPRRPFSPKISGKTLNPDQTRNHFKLKPESLDEKRTPQTQAFKLRESGLACCCDRKGPWRRPRASASINIRSCSCHLLSPWKQYGPFSWWSQTWSHTAYTSDTGGREDRRKTGCYATVSRLWKQNNLDRTQIDDFYRKLHIWSRCNRWAIINFAGWSFTLLLRQKIF